MEPIDFLSRTVEFWAVEFWDIAHYSQAQSGVKATQIVTYPCEISSGTEPVCAGKPVYSLYYMSKMSEGISLDNLVRKNNTLHHYPTPYPCSSG